jgi:hypothetical protein
MDFWNIIKELKTLLHVCMLLVTCKNEEKRRFEVKRASNQSNKIIQKKLQPKGLVDLK